jgi:hypothetical protein
MNEKADALYPGWRETIDRSKRDGAFLRNAAILCVKAVRQREDLSEFERSRAKDAEAEFKAIFEKALEQGFLNKEDAFTLAEATQVLAAAAGLEPEELRKLNEKLRSQSGRPGGQASSAARRKKAEQWKAWVADNAPSMRCKHPTSGQEDLADKLITLALTKNVFVPDRSAVVKHLSALERTGQLSERTRSRGERTRSRTKPLR